jgi:neutral trehalase
MWRRISAFLSRQARLQTSTNKSGNQWDAPFGWAPMQIIAERSSVLELEGTAALQHRKK